MVCDWRLSRIVIIHPEEGTNSSPETSVYDQEWRRVRNPGTFLHNNHGESLQSHIFTPVKNSSWYKNLVYNIKYT